MSSDNLASDDNVRQCSLEELISNDNLKVAVNRLGFLHATPVQAAAIPAALKGEDLIIQAKTGSGKTLAFALPMLAALEESRRIQEQSTFALVVTPTRELAQQICGVIESLNTGVKPTLVIGGVPFRSQQKALQSDCRVVVGTPGRLLDLLDQRIVRLNKCAFFVLDEVDEMFSMGFFEDVRSILARIPAKRQGVFVSATVTPRVTMLADSFLSQARQITVDEMGRDLPTIEHCYCDVGAGVMNKPDALCDLLEVYNPGSAIIFCNTRSDTDLLDVVLRRRGFNARKLNSELTQQRRQIIMQKIRASELRYMVATDIAARGLDIEQIEMVVNYALHDEPDVYVHRTGRTGRAGRGGRAVSLIGPQDRLPFRNVKRVVEVEFKELALPTDQEVSKARLSRVLETLKRESVEADARDLLTAEMLLAEAGMMERNEELVRMTGRFCSHLLQSQAAAEADELDDEHEKAEELEQPTRRGRDREGSRGPRGRHSSRRR